jgi:methyltransferase family protein
MPGSTVPRAAREAARALGDRRAVPALGWIARLAGVEPSAVTNVLGETDRFLDTERYIRTTQRNGGRSFYAQFRAPLDVYALSRLIGAREIVETGVSSGVSSAHFLLAVRRNRHGRLHSIDLPTRQKSIKLRDNESPVSLPPGRESGWAIPPQLTVGWDLRIGPSQKLLPSLVDRLGEVSLFLHDSHHTPAHLTFELETIRPRLRPGSVVLADNTVWTGKAFDRFAKAMGAPVVRRRRSDLVGLRVPSHTRH